MKHIKVNGFIINPRQIAMLDRKAAQTFSNGTSPSGVYVIFAAGGRQWIADPEAKAVEQAFMDYDHDEPLPY